jgi:Prp8 binding protein
MNVFRSSDGLRLFTASADKTAVAWDMETFQPIKKFKGHTSYVNSCHPSRRGSSKNLEWNILGADLLVTGGDDGVTKLWDLRAKKHQQEFEGKVCLRYG